MAVERITVEVDGIPVTICLLYTSLQAIGDGRGVLTVLLTVDVVGFVLLNAIGLLLFFVWRLSLIHI